MKKSLKILALGLLIQAVGAVFGQSAEDPVAQKYLAALAKIFDLQARVRPIHPLYAKVYPVAIVENKTFYIFEPGPEGKAYRLVQTSPDTLNIAEGTLAAFPLSFWDNRMACVVTGKAFEEPDAYAFLFHEFVHCAQWDCCDLKLKQRLSIFQAAMKKKDYMWELQFPFPYAKPDFVRLHGQLLVAWDLDDGSKVESLRSELKKSLSAEEWEYMTWVEWKEGLARYLENRVRPVLGLRENKGGETAPFNRVTLYRGGDKFIRFLERRHPGISKDMEKLYWAISTVPVSR
jgi:hypothetical protein